MALLAVVGCTKSPDAASTARSTSDAAAPPTGDDAGVAASTDTVAPTEVTKQLADAYCAWATRCCSAADLALVLPGATDHASCKEVYEKESTLGADIGASVAADRSSYSGQAAARCIASMAARSCEELSAQIASATVFAFPAACKSPLAPRGDALPRGQQCTQDFECASGYCAYTSVGTVGPGLAEVRAPGSCATRAQKPASAPALCIAR
jgi:hypothetical protein